MVYYVDTHCHLDLFQGIRQSVQAEDSKPIKTITVTNSPLLWEPNQKLFGNCKNIRAALGLHPELAFERAHETSNFSNFINQTRYIGEIGLDGGSADPENWASQLTVFQRILETIRSSTPKIVSVHSRGAAKETIRELANICGAGRHKVILHWFTGDSESMNDALQLGCYFSINHRMVASKKGQNLIALLPSNRVLTETDAPFTFSDRVTNRETSLQITIGGLQKLWYIDYEHTKAVVWENFRSLLSPAH